MSNVNASVTLTLTELDSLRNDIAKGKAKEQALIQQIKDAEAKQKQVKVTVRVREFYPETQRVRDYGAEQARFNDRDKGSYVSRFDFDSSPIYKYDCVMKERNHENIEYINFDQVQEDLKLRAQQLVADQIVALEAQLSKTTQENISLQKAVIKQRDELVAGFSSERVTIEEKHTKEMKVLVDEIKRLKNEEVEKTKDREIADLRKQIEELSNKKGFFSSLF